MKVLIVEDNPAVRRLIRLAISDVADEIAERADGSDALQAYEEHHPDVVLMDVKMSRMDGLVATRQVLQFHPTARIVIVTDYDDDGLRTAASEAGACGYVLKNDLMLLEAFLSHLTC
ncbi:response regulator [Terriglobus roseus]|nr:response regulator transcription factor [Terriglobus roseus]